MKRLAARAIASVVMGIALCAPRLGAAQAVGATLRDTTSAADSIVNARTAAIAATLRCPVCQGESIQDSPAELAQQMRAVVRERVRAGQPPEEIKAYFVSKYGEWILLEPRMTGLNVLLYVLPVALIVGGLALVAILVKRWTNAPKESTD